MVVLQVLLRRAEETNDPFRIKLIGLFPQPPF
jgi:hypothetical protein